ncbi:MAG: hypothetical protein Q9162_001444 [Coniocarpon cinnabarinum]
MAPSKTAPAPSSSQDSFAYSLLRRANSPSTADDVYTSKIQNKRLALLPTGSKPLTPYLQNKRSQSLNQPEPPKQPDARTLRQQCRQHRYDSRRLKARHKPKPASAREIRTKQLHTLPPPSPQTFKVYRGLHELWCQYMRDALGISDAIASGRAKQYGVHVTPAGAGPILTTADYHGAEMEVVRSTCDGRVGLKGIVVRDSKFTFVLCLSSGRFVRVPKEGTWFRFGVPLPSEERARQTDDAGEVIEGAAEQKDEKDKRELVFEIQGDHFKTKSAMRAGKKFRWHPPKDP